MERNEKFVEELVRAQGELNAYVAALLPFHADDVADVVQETNLSLVAAQDRYNPSRPFVPWALSFARMKVQAYFRDAKRERVLFSSETIERLADLYEEDRDRQADTEQSTLLERLKVCREKLKERERLLLSLFYDEKMPLKTIAGRLRRPEPSLRVTLSSIRGKLGKCIRNLCRLEETGHEERAARSIDRVVDLATLGGRPSASLLREADAECRLLDDNALRDVFDQLFVDALLKGPCAAARAVPAAVLPWRKAVSVAACLALCAGAGFWAKARLDSRRAAAEPVEARAVVAESRPAAVESLDRPLPVAATHVGKTAEPSSLAKTSVPEETEANLLTARLAVQKEGESDMKKEIVAAAAAVALAPPIVLPAVPRVASVPAASEGAYGDFSAVVIETRDGSAADINSVPFIEVRDGGTADFLSRTIDTSKPLGTVVMLM